MRRRLLLAAGAAGLAACAPARIVPLPALPAVVPLRPAYFHNPRFPTPDPAWVDAILVHARTLAAEHFGIALAWEPLVRRDLSDAFVAVDAPARARLASAVYDLDRGDRARLVAATRRELHASGTDAAGLLAYARPHLVRPPASPGLDGLAQALVETQLARIGAWRSLQGPDGRPLLDGTPYSEYLGWVAAASASQWPCEVIVTNQLVASVEYEGNHMHSALRGGVSNGLTLQSPGSRYGTVAVLSLFPFASNDAATLRLRGGDRGGTPEAAQWAAALLVHEMGHQLLHLHHPFGRPACVMNPPPLLRFREWVAGLDAQACTVGSSVEMRPGAVRFRIP